MKVKHKAVYDPAKNYEWAPETEFVLSGREFEAIVHALGIANSIVQNAFVEGVASGIITEAVTKEEPKANKVVKEQPIETLENI